MTEKHVLYPGTFDPVTLGHCDILVRALRVFDRVTVAVSTGGRPTLFDTGTRVKLVEAAAEELGIGERVKVVPFAGLLVDTLRATGAGTAIRGLRTPGDMEHEQTMAALNMSLDPTFEVVVFFSRPEMVMVSGSLVRDVARCGGPVEKYVPTDAAVALRDRFADER